MKAQFLGARLSAFKEFKIGKSIFPDDCQEMSCCRKEISDMTGNKDENVKGVAGEGSKPVKRNWKCEFIVYY